ncbi:MULTISPECIES: peptide chain release factor N(5)-glutamine methyltransferase [Streptococcus]|uniref:peptide chain release factor N(5)-glutamine methyltransferase n=1 Tax=Streptococcus TaxID=1301 RepID=UPI000CF61AD9|nr:peptide chain release factor N(5)-glutamine methyltransferase [Streptococcus suis]MBM7313102.1 peptide chain release factor N(5)-glutamine methyltransferase [Streptococcus suis]MBM7319045.1 peptide chain release factor N(5)-glutamine methyltransferase [Streptococcus suis]MBY4964651.1 peptide chain release factor N(5)-glutamine methyltransferase [Streptococcus suis]MCO8241039.1 peptide chain release factor N(5)-glutamine methyltransferase [Streptococcus suis]TII09463.1 peptide chain release 
MNYAQLFAAYEEQLVAIGEEAESLSFTFRGLKGLNFTEFLLLLRQEVTPTNKEEIDAIFQQLSQHRPAQYIIGKADFYGLEFAVDERVLIPRPETEELVDLILQENSGAGLRILDIGTGSGAIAISLAKARPDWEVVAVDISKDALAVAKENARTNQVSVHFLESDVLQAVTGQFDIIVSNPPYISPDDTDEVGLNVLTSEPHLALFAEEDGMAIYRQIAEQAGTFLKEDGKLYFEIGYKQGQDLTDLLALHFPKKRIRVLKDQFGQDRKVVADDNG